MQIVLKGATNRDKTKRFFLTMVKPSQPQSQSQSQISDNRDSRLRGKPGDLTMRLYERTETKA